MGKSSVEVNAEIAVQAIRAVEAQYQIELDRQLSSRVARGTFCLRSRGSFYDLVFVEEDGYECVHEFGSFLASAAVKNPEMLELMQLLADWIEKKVS